MSGMHFFTIVDHVGGATEHSDPDYPECDFDAYVASDWAQVSPMFGSGRMRAVRHETDNPQQPWFWNCEKDVGPVDETPNPEDVPVDDEQV